MQEHNVFVYGTLRAGNSRDSVLKESEKIPGIFKLDGFRMVSLRAFPAIVPGESTIVGEVYTVNDKTLRLLDAIEGTSHGLYTRETVSVSSEDGTETVKAFVYVGGKRIQTHDYPTIESGDWMHRGTLSF